MLNFYSTLQEKNESCVLRGSAELKIDYFRVFRITSRSWCRSRGLDTVKTTKVSADVADVKSKRRHHHMYMFDSGTRVSQSTAAS